MFVCCRSPTARTAPGSWRPQSRRPVLCCALVLACRIGVDAAGQALEALLQRPHAGLRGLTVSGLPLQTSFVAQLAELTHLTSLQLVG